MMARQDFKPDTDDCEGSFDAGYLQGIQDQVISITEGLANLGRTIEKWSPGFNMRKLMLKWYDHHYNKGQKT